MGDPSSIAFAPPSNELLLMLTIVVLVQNPLIQLEKICENSIVGIDLPWCECVPLVGVNDQGKEEGCSEGKEIGNRQQPERPRVLPCISLICFLFLFLSHRQSSD